MTSRTRKTADAPPPEVADDPVAAATWRATTSALREAGLWSDADRAAVARYSLLSSAWEAARRDVATNGPVTTTRSGYEAPRPAAVMLVKLGASLLSLEQALGLSPRSRSRLKVAPKPADDDPERRLLERLKVRV